MNSERIKVIASLVDKDDYVLDVGTDHGYLSIYLYLNKLCKNIICSDISSNALNFAINNFKKYNARIKYYVSDGFNSINDKFNTAVIAGMGTSTILDIISSDKCPNKLIISSNNEYYKLRKSLNKMGFKIIKEIIVKENNHYYDIIKCIKGYQKLPKKYLKYGISNNKEYYNYLLEKNNLLLKKVPFKKKITIYYDNLLLKKLINKIPE